MSKIMQNFEKEKPDITNDWVVYSELRKRVEELTISTLEDQLGVGPTRQIIKTATTMSGQSQYEMFSDYENFVRTIEDVFGEQGQKTILSKIPA